MILVWEFRKMFRKWRTYIGFIAIAVVIPLVEAGLKLDQKSTLLSLIQELSMMPQAAGNIFNGYFVTRFVLNGLCLWLVSWVVTGETMNLRNIEVTVLAVGRSPPVHELNPVSTLKRSVRSAPRTSVPPSMKIFCYTKPFGRLPGHPTPSSS